MKAINHAITEGLGWLTKSQDTKAGVEGALCNTGCLSHLWKWFLYFANELTGETNLSPGLLGEDFPSGTFPGQQGKTVPLFPHIKNITKILVSENKGLFPHHSPCSTELRTLMCAVKVSYSLGTLSLGVCKGIWEFTFSQASLSLMYFNVIN